ncbi:hypothetical protein, partial [Mycolicibacterium sp. 624]|uniref:hypothetical protein n=1 Tax=Mycolicibacterium sp. 624 TaxID=3156314 RepID=UPI0033925E88
GRGQLLPPQSPGIDQHVGLPVEFHSGLADAVDELCWFGWSENVAAAARDACICAGAARVEALATSGFSIVFTLESTNGPLFETLALLFLPCLDPA